MSCINLPTIRSKWKDKNNNIFTVILVTNLALEAKYQGRQIDVIYVDCRGNFWSSPLVFWYSSMTQIQEEEN